MTHTTKKYLAFLALGVVIFHWKTLLTDQFTSLVGSEGINQVYAWLHFWLRSVWTGHIPLWDPYAWGGRPFAGETQTTSYYPLRFLFALVPLNRNGLISPRFFHEYLAFTEFLAGCFMFALARELGRSHFAAFLAACAFSMAGVLSKLPWPHHVEACIWMPLVLLFLLRARRASTKIGALAEASLSGVCLGVSALSGGVQFSMIEGICVLGGVFYSGKILARGGDKAHWPRDFSIAVTIMAIAGCAAAAQLIPSFQYGHLSVRYIAGGWFPMDMKIPYDRMDHGMWPQSIMTGLFPVGPVAGGGEAWPYYIGVFPFFLSVIALWKNWRDPWVRYLSSVAILSFLYALGEYSPLNGVVYAVVPYIWNNREPSRFFYLISFALAVLSAFGMDSLLEGAGQPALWAPVRPFLKWGSIFCGMVIVVTDLFPQLQLGIWPCMSLLLIIGSCAFVFRLTLRPASTPVLVFIACFVLFDFTVFNWSEANRNELQKAGDKYEQMLTLRPVADFIKAQPGLHRVRVAVDPEPNIGDTYGLESLAGGGATALRAFSRMSPHEDLLNVRYRVKPASTPDPGAVYHDALWKVYEDKAGFPRAWLVHQTVFEPTDDAALARLNKPGIDFHNVAIVERPLPQPLDASTAADSLRFRSYEPDRLSLDATTAGSALVVLSEIYYPDWRATVNGKEVEIRKVDSALRGIVVSAGHSHVSLEYRPLGSYVGIGVSLFTILVVPLFWIVIRRNRI